MNIYTNLKIAEEMGLPRQFAIRARQRYLTAEKRKCREWVDFYRSLHYDEEDINYHYVGFLIADELALMKEIDREVRSMKRMNESEITDEHIASARSYPVDKLIDFKRGKAKAFCHDDNNPSMYHATKINKAACPVCAKYFDSIAILTNRDGLSFIDAVKQLSSI